MNKRDSKDIIQIQITLLTAVIALTAILNFMNDNTIFQKSYKDISFTEIPTIIIIIMMLVVIMFSIFMAFKIYLKK